MEDTTPCENSREWSKTKDFQSDEAGIVLTSTRKFGVEIECIAPNEEAYYVVANKFKTLGAGLDGGGREFKTPIIGGKLGEFYINTLGELLAAKKYTVEHTCGMHLHVDCGIDFLEKDSTKTGSRKTENLKNLFHFLLTYENVIQSFLPPSRRQKSWCEPLHWMSHQEVKKCATQFDIEKLWYRYQDKATIDSCKQGTRGGPRPGFNFSPFFADNNVEIRYHSGTINARKILEWANLFTTILDKAATSWLERADVLRMPSLEEKTALFFVLLGLPKSSREYFLARQKMFTKAVPVEVDMNKMKSIIMADSEILV